uniref:Uncharacterized protein n=1 Tax=Setaria italica TaxID=4555 RepID=K4A3Z0_SETIT
MTALLAWPNLARRLNCSSGQCQGISFYVPVLRSSAAKASRVLGNRPAHFTLSAPRTISTLTPTSPARRVYGGRQARLIGSAAPVVIARPRLPAGLGSSRRRFLLTACAATGQSSARLRSGNFLRFWATPRSLV